MIRLVILDKDGTLVAPVGRRPANTPDEQHVLPGVVAKLAKLRRAGVILAMASNQGGVAWGFLTEADAHALMRDAAGKVGGSVLWRCCCYDERAAARNPASPYAKPSRRRKPGPGMLQEIMRAAGCSPDQTLMVGDQETDRQAAEAAGCNFQWAKEFFGWQT
jgi:D-glycero-D-manno-heptose 1,7-bisphosphate phosphatase